jgi:hypothetical protein
MEAAYDHMQKLALYSLNKNSDFPYESILERFHNILDDRGLADYEFSKWENLYDVGGLKEKILSLPEYYVNGYGEKKIIPRNHFMIEIFRTPTSEPPTLFNLFKIGFYAGLVRSNIKVSDYPDGVVKLFRDLKLHTLSNYIAKDSPVRLPENIIELISNVFKTNLEI